MHAADLQALYHYHYWANARLFAALEQLTPEQFTRGVAGSYGSVRNTLVHTLSAEWGWLDRCGGEKRGEKLSGERYPTLASLVAEAARVQGYVRAFLGRLSDADLDRSVEWSFSPDEVHRNPLGHLMQHAAIHAIHHRGQVALLARELGVAPGNFDFLFWPDERATTS